MRLKCSTMRRRAVMALLAVCVSALCACDAPQGDPRLLSGEPETKGSSATKQGELGIVAMTTLRVRPPAGRDRLLAHVLVENRGEADLTVPWTLVITKRGGASGLSECHGDPLPAGRVARCAMWLAEGAFDEGDLIEGHLDRGVLAPDQGGRGTGTSVTSDSDVRVTTIRWTPTGADGVRITDWSVVPRRLPAPGVGRFSFSVSGGHLVWLVVPWAEERLLGGDPADGTIAGRGELDVVRSGEVALVARNSLGSFVYQTLDLSVERSRGRATQPVPIARLQPTVRAVMLAEGLFDVDENELVLEELRRRLSR